MDVYLLFAILLGQVKSKVNLQTYNFQTDQSIRYKYVNQF